MALPKVQKRFHNFAETLSLSSTMLNSSEFHHEDGSQHAESHVSDQ